MGVWEYQRIGEAAPANSHFPISNLQFSISHTPTPPYLHPNRHPFAAACRLFLGGADGERVPRRASGGHRGQFAPLHPFGGGLQLRRKSVGDPRRYLPPFVAGEQFHRRARARVVAERGALEIDVVAMLERDRAL